LIKILGGQHYEETLTAHRIAFSIFGKINSLNKEKVEGLFIQAFDEKTKQIQETAIDRNGEYRLRGMTPGNKYIIKVKIPSSSSIEKALPASIPITLGKEDVTGVEFVVLQRPKKIDIRGYLNFTDDEDMCPFTRAQNSYVELHKLDEEEDSVPKSKQINNACQFVFRHLDKKRYLVKVFEKQAKANTTPKMLYEYTVDLSDEREINGGVKIMKINIENSKKFAADNLNYTVYSPILLFTLVFCLLKLDYSIWIFQNVISKPFTFIGKLFSKRR
jgi:hypothetical protein